MTSQESSWNKVKIRSTIINLIYTFPVRNLVETESRSDLKFELLPHYVDWAEVTALHTSLDWLHSREVGGNCNSIYPLILCTLSVIVFPTNFQPSTRVVSPVLLPKKRNVLELSINSKRCIMLEHISLAWIGQTGANVQAVSSWHQRLVKTELNWRKRMQSSALTLENSN